ncbi:hypothetical protein phiRKBJ001_76 [Streptomyces phage phiRKBJ001]|nr:hypothetical protein phiRKBJ001_76 [Streptomyces phage phiRKBJ001]
MRCGNCKGDHPSVALVRSCFANNEGQPSPKQMSLAQALGREKVRLPEYQGMSEEDYHLAIAGLGRKAMGDFLDRMLKMPSDGPTREELFDKLDNGKYALRNEDNEDVRFYCIGGVRPRILWELTGSPGDFKMQRIYRPEKILARIGADPLAAYVLFGLSVGKCGRCGSPLTQKHTRDRGMGDICYSKMIG